METHDNNSKITKEQFGRIKWNILSSLSVDIFMPDVYRIENAFNDLARKNHLLLDPTHENPAISFIYEGRVYFKSYRDVTALELDKSLYKNADRLIKQKNALTLAQKNLNSIFRIVLMHSNNYSEIWQYTPKILHKTLSEFVSKNILEAKSTIDLTEHQIQVHTQLTPYVENVKRYLVNRALFYRN